MESPAVRNARGLKQRLFTPNIPKGDKGKNGDWGGFLWGFNGWRRDAERDVKGSAKRR